MVLRRIAGFLLPALRRPMRCECCGCDFICGAGITGCWCMKVGLDTQVRAELRKRFRDCLCLKCSEGSAQTQIHT